jgi:hypothetical protein
MTLLGTFCEDEHFAFLQEKNIVGESDPVGNIL